jgi:hypothetical protein
MKHTKGPWTLVKRDADFYEIKELGLQLISPWDIEENEANAALISAAPELLEDLESLLSQLIKEDSLKTTPEERLSWAVMSEIDRCQQTIAKAKGDA